jgi:hypothetical protein
MSRRKLGLAALVAVLAMAVAVSPASAASKKAEKKQNRSLRSLNQRTKKTDKALKSLAGNLGTLTADVAGAKNGLAAIQAAVPTVVSSLTTLGDAARQLKTGLETAGAGLTALQGGLEGLGSKFGKSVGGVEYGVVQLYFDPEGDGFEANDALPGQLLTSADVPDDANQSTVTGKLFFAIPDGTTAKQIALKAGMRSGEKDGTGAANPVGQAGLMAMTVSTIGAAGTSAGGGNPGAPTSLPLTSKPNAAAGGLPVYSIPTKAPRSDASPNPVGFPDGLMIELTDPATLKTLTAAPGRFTVTNTSGGPASGIVDVTVRFHDLTPASADNLDE